jgi:hypothetical protein
MRRLDGKSDNRFPIATPWYPRVSAQMAGESSPRAKMGRLVYGMLTPANRRQFL